MGFLWFIISMAILGLIAGALARLIMPGKDPMTLGQTAILGIVGSFVGGFLLRVIFGTDSNDGLIQTSSLIGSVLGALVLLFIWRKFIKK